MAIYIGEDLAVIFIKQITKLTPRLLNLDSYTFLWKKSIHIVKYNGPIGDLQGKSLM